MSTVNEELERVTGELAPRRNGHVRTILGVRACDCGIQGPENLILAMGEHLRDVGVRYVIANLWDGDPPTVELHDEAQKRGLESHIIRTNWGMDPSIATRVTSLARELKPDVIHTHDIKAEFAGVVASRLTRTPLVGSFYGRLVVHSLFMKVADLCRFPTFHLFDRVLPNSRMQNRELKEWRVRDDRIEIVPSFVDASRIRPATAEQKAGARELLGIDPSRPVLATVAKLSPNKGHIYMIRAMSEIRESHPDVLYLVPGEGDAPWRGEGGLRGELETAVRDAGLEDHVRFLGYYPDVLDILHATDVLVSPSLLEGMQVALLEAMAAGLPIVATAIGGTTDAVVDGETGILVSPADPGALARGVLEALSDRDRLRRMGDAGRRRLEENFDVRVVADQVHRICEEVATSRRT